MPLTLPALIKTIGNGSRSARDLAEDDACALLDAMLRGAIPDLELGALLIAMRIKGESPGEMRGFLRALAPHVATVALPRDSPRAVVVPSYNGARRHPNLTALVALLLARDGIPVIVHGLAGEVEADDDDAPAAAGADPASFGRVTTSAILRELGVAPAATVGEVDAALATRRIAYAPLAVLAPGLAGLLAHRARLGVRSFAHSLAKLIDPCRGSSYRLVSVTHADYLDRMRDLLAATHADALLLRGTEGEPFANPRRQPQLEDFRAGACSVQATAQGGSIVVDDDLPAATDPASTADWIRRAVAGGARIPEPIRAQVACCAAAARRPSGAV